VVNEAEPDATGKQVGKALSIAEISARLQSLEDRFEILTLLSALPHSSDVGDQDFQNRAYHGDCVMDRDNADALMVGKAAIVDIIGSDKHRQAIENGMVHFAGLPHIRIQGEGSDARAVATGYLQIVVPITAASLAAGPTAAGQRAELSGYGPSDGLAIWRLTANHWELEKDDGRWKVIRRDIRSVPSSGAHEIIAGGLK
jgi:SnoaL-like domain